MMPTADLERRGRSVLAREDEDDGYDGPEDDPTGNYKRRASPKAPSRMDRMILLGRLQWIETRHFRPRAPGISNFVVNGSRAKSSTSNRNSDSLAACIVPAKKSGLFLSS
jgi:hypothetical protein